MMENATFFGARRGIAPPRHPSKMRTALQACQKCQPVAVWAGRGGYLANAGLRRGIVCLSHPPARAEIVICLFGLLARDDRDLALDRFALEISGGKRPNPVLRNKILWLALPHPPAGVEEDYSIFPRCWLALVQHHDHPGSVGVVKKIVRQQDYAIDQIPVDEPFCLSSGREHVMS